MKKLLVALLTLSLLLGSFLSLAVSADTSPVKDYKTAAYGELLYTVNFNGDSAFAPSRRGVEDEMAYTISQDGSSLTIAGKTGGNDKKANYFGGSVKGLISDSINVTYTMTYMVDASANPTKNNSIGVGGILTLEGVEGEMSPVFYNNYSNHGQAGSDTRSAISLTNLKYNDAYVKWNTLEKTAKIENNYVTMANVLDLSRDALRSYYIAADGTWLFIEEQTLSWFDSNEDLEGVTIGFMTYSYYSAVNTTVKDVKFYKGDIITNTLPEGAPADTGNTGGDTGNTGDNNTGNTDNTDTTTTKAPETTTKAPETTAAAEKKGCGSSIGFAGLALVATVATVGVAKKRKND